MIAQIERSGHHLTPTMGEAPEAGAGNLGDQAAEIHHDLKHSVALPHAADELPHRRHHREVIEESDGTRSRDGVKTAARF